MPGGGQKIVVDAEDGSTVLDVLASLGIHQDLFMFALINGEKADLSRKIGEGDDVVLVSALSGG